MPYSQEIAIDHLPPLMRFELIRTFTNPSIAVFCFTFPSGKEVRLKTPSSLMGFFIDR